jgi:hypothetical protein
MKTRSPKEPGFYRAVGGCAACDARERPMTKIESQGTFRTRWIFEVSIPRCALDCFRASQATRPPTAACHQIRSEEFKISFDNEPRPKKTSPYEFARAALDPT